MMRLFMSAARCMTLAGFALLGGLGAPASAQTSLPRPGETVITQEMIRSHGITRLHDILWLVDGVRLSTIDDFSYTASINGLGRSDQNRWRVFVDGLPEALGDWGVQNLDWLTIPLDEIDSVKVVASPGMLAGLPAPWGRIEIWTRKASEGVGASAMLMAINETGDPGPFRYSREELRLANIDKSGPDGAAALSWHRDALTIRASATMMQHIPSDVAAFSRNRAAFDTPTTPELLLRSLALSVSHEQDDRGHALSLRALDMDDMLFLSSVTREVPVVQRYASGSYRFRAGISKRRWLSVLTNVSRLSVENHERATRRPLNWDALRWTTSAQLSLGRDVVLGASMVVSQVDSDQLQTGSRGAVLASVTTKVSRSMGDFSGALSTDGKRVGFFASVRQTHALSEAHSLGLVGAAARLVNEEIGSAEYWTIRGLRIDRDTPIEVEDVAREAWLVFAQADWRYSLNNSWLSVGVG
ncbi:MAG: TonB-dependent receptor plug domain-containing protein, partial [Rhodothermia bacterium]|nr:TonB-dependent receptor plug domain-containing protein [Rhodothermia bacterium]